MARRRTRTATRSITRLVGASSPKPIIIRAPSVGMSRGRRYGLAVRRGVSAVASRAREEKHTLIAIASAAALGATKRFNVDLPKIDLLGHAGTYGIAAWVASRYTKSQILAHVATGLLSVAAYELASGAGVTGVGADDGLSGTV